MRAATIDAGSNTLRLLIGRVVEDRVFPEHYHRRICRLAGNFSQRTGLSAEARQRTLCVFKEFADLCRRDRVQQIRAVGTETLDRFGVRHARERIRQRLFEAEN